MNPEKTPTAFASTSVKVQALLRLIGQRIRHERVAQALTQQALAARLVLSRDTVARMEAGDPRVALGVWAATLEIFQLDDVLSQLAVSTPDAATRTRASAKRVDRTRERLFGKS